MIYTRQGTPDWGPRWKHAAVKNYLRSFAIGVHGSCMSAAATTSAWIRATATTRPMLRMIIRDSSTFVGCAVVQAFAESVVAECAALGDGYGSEDETAGDQIRANLLSQD
ncbi:hypothetical protein [Variovorax sp. GT1P44]|uniref:hypothetical protein n=1 Tax=Variovorax sp. GT1P44 TaxID=3443742 RepID=UPI003F48CE33